MNTPWQSLTEGCVKGSSGVSRGEPAVWCRCLVFVLEQTTRNVYLELAHVERFVLRKRT